MASVHTVSRNQPPVVPAAGLRRDAHVPVFIVDGSICAPAAFAHSGVSCGQVHVVPDQVDCLGSAFGEHKHILEILPVTEVAAHRATAVLNPDHGIVEIKADVMKVQRLPEG